MNPNVLPGLALLEDALGNLGRNAAAFEKSPFITERQAEKIRRERLHVAAVKRRKKRKNGGPK